MYIFWAGETEANKLDWYGMHEMRILLLFCDCGQSRSWHTRGNENITWREKHFQCTQMIAFTMWATTKGWFGQHWHILCGFFFFRHLCRMIVCWYKTGNRHGTLSNGKILTSSPPAVLANYLLLTNIRSWHNNHGTFATSDATTTAAATTMIAATLLQPSLLLLLLLYNYTTFIATSSVTSIFGLTEFDSRHAHLSLIKKIKIVPLCVTGRKNKVISTKVSCYRGVVGS